MEEKAFSGNGETVLLPLRVAEAIVGNGAALRAFDTLSEDDLKQVIREARKAVSQNEINNIVRSLEGS